MQKRKLKEMGEIDNTLPKPKRAGGKLICFLLILVQILSSEYIYWGSEITIILRLKVAILVRPFSVRFT